MLTSAGYLSFRDISQIPNSSLVMDMNYPESDQGMSVWPLSGIFSAAHLGHHQQRELSPLNIPSLDRPKHNPLCISFSGAGLGTFWTPQQATAGSGWQFPSWAPGWPASALHCHATCSWFPSWPSACWPSDSGHSQVISLLPFSESFKISLPLHPTGFPKLILFGWFPLLLFPLPLLLAVGWRCCPWFYQSS